MLSNASQFNFDTAPDSALVKSDLVMQVHGGISRATLDRRIKGGLIPKPAISNRVRYWKVGELREALQKLTKPSQPDSQVQGPDWSLYERDKQQCLQSDSQTQA